MPHSGPERRSNPRHLCSHLVEITARDSGGGERRLTGLLEDLSPEGAAVALEEAVAEGAAVELTAPGFRAAARVRYCETRETDFRLGLEFTAGSQWQPEDWTPDHMFLPPKEEPPKK